MASQVLHFTPNEDTKQVPHHMRYLYIPYAGWDCVLRAGGDGGSVLAYCPYHGSRAILLPDTANIIALEFINLPQVAQHSQWTQAVDVWISTDPLRFDGLKEFHDDPNTGITGSQPALQYGEITSTKSAYAAPITAIAGERTTHNGGVDLQQAQLAQVSEFMDTDIVSDIQRYGLRVATDRSKTQTYRALGAQSGMPHHVGFAAPIGKSCLSYIDTSGINGGVCDFRIIGAKLWLYASTVAANFSAELARYGAGTDLTALNAGSTGISPVRLDGLYEDDFTSAQHRRVTTVGLAVPNALEVVLTRRPFILGIIGAATVANPIQYPVDIDLVDLDSRENYAPISIVPGYLSRNAAPIFAINIEVDAATTIRYVLEWTYTMKMRTNLYKEWA